MDLDVAAALKNLVDQIISFVIPALKPGRYLLVYRRTTNQFWAHTSHHTLAFVYLRKVLASE